jgi:archaellum biogenesis protein FlaJ (TadC family)
MTKKQVPSENQLNKDEAELIGNISESFEKLEHSFSFTTPDLTWFEQKIVEHKKQIQKKWRQDLLMFSAVAVVILSLMVTALFQQPYLFVALQVITVFFLIGYTGYEFRKKRELISHE